MTRFTLTAALDAAVDVIQIFDIVPLAFDLDKGGAEIVSTMSQGSLIERSTGPYHADRPSPEAVSTVRLISSRWSGRPERPDVTVEVGGRWPRVVMFLPASGVLVRFVVPEEAPGYPPGPGDVTLSADVRLALAWIRDSLNAARELTGDEPPIGISLSYIPDPDLDSRPSQIPHDVHAQIPPVVPVLEVDRNACTREQRHALNAALRARAHRDQEFESLGRTGFTTRLGFTQIETSHG